MAKKKRPQRNGDAQWCPYCEEWHNPCPTAEELPILRDAINAAWSPTERRSRAVQKERVTMGYLVAGDSCPTGQVIRRTHN